MANKQWQNKRYVWTTDARTKNSNRGVALERVETVLAGGGGWGVKGSNKFNSRETWLLIFVQLKITNIYSVRIASSSVKYRNKRSIITNPMMKQSSVAIERKNTRKPQIGPRWTRPHHIWSGANLLKLVVPLDIRINMHKLTWAFIVRMCHVGVIKSGDVVI